MFAARTPSTCSRARFARRVVIFALAMVVPKTHGEDLRFVFTGHLYPLVESDRLFELADRIAAEKPDFVVVGGDVVSGPYHRPGFSPTMLEEQWAKFDLFVERLGAEVHVVPGNHDVSSYDPAWRSAVQHAFPKCWKVPRKLDVAGVRLIFLGSTTPSTGAFGLSDQQLDFLRDSLTDDAAARSFLFVHHRLWELDDWAARVRPVLDDGTERWVFSGDMQEVVSRRDGPLHLFGCGNGRETLSYLTVHVSKASVHVVRTAEGVAAPSPPPAWLTHVKRACKDNLKTYTVLLAAAFLVCGFVAGAVLIRGRTGLARQNRARQYTWHDKCRP